MEAVYTGIHIHKQVHVSEADIPQSLKIVIYRVLQEALNNVVKHSGASMATLTMDMKKGRLVLMIQDDGEGFDVQATLSGKGHGKGFGLAGMRERTELSGGSFSIESSPGAGTTIGASWPGDPAGSTG
jgi:signal transduction histidine kinase